MSLVDKYISEQCFTFANYVMAPHFNVHHLTMILVKQSESNIL
jgi:hypothetical protein